MEERPAATTVPFPTAEDGALIAAIDSEASGVPEISLPDFGLRKDGDIPGRCVAETETSSSSIVLARCAAVRPDIATAANS